MHELLGLSRHDSRFLLVFESTLKRTFVRGEFCFQNLNLFMKDEDIE